MEISRTIPSARLALAALALVSGCGSDPRPPGTEVRADVDRTTHPDVTATEVATQVNGNTVFAIDLYRRLATGNDDLFFAPHSIEVAMAMTWAGARGQTEADMASVMHYYLDRDRLHAAFNQLDLDLTARADCSRCGDGFRLRLANAVFGQTGTTFLDDYLTVLARHYGAGVHLLDLAGASEPSRAAINAWVDEVTDGRIPEVLPAGAIRDTTRLVQVNAILFKAAWSTPFRSSDTVSAPFHTASGATVAVPMMRQLVRGSFAVRPGYTAVELPYQGEQLAMLVLVPDARDGLPALEAQLSIDLIADVRAELVWGDVLVTMPRWEHDGAPISLRESLSALGMEVAFGPAADLSGIDGHGGLRIEDVLHRAFVKVNEAGTEAAAATAVTDDVVSLPPRGPDTVLDHPFIYLIWDRTSGQILFLGRVMDPS